MAEYPPAVGLERGPVVKYAVIYEQTPRNWAAYVPDLPGCVATGATRPDVERLIREAIALHLDAMRQSGARTAVQDEATSVVFGMPKVAHEKGGAECMKPLGKIAATVKAYLGLK